MRPTPPGMRSSASPPTFVSPVRGCSRAVKFRPSLHVSKVLSDVPREGGVVASGDGEVDTYLLLHLPTLELVPAEFSVIYILAFLLVPLCDDVLHLSHKAPAGPANRLACFLESVLRPASEVGLDSARGHELCCGCCDVVARHYQLLGAIPSADDAVRSLYQGVGGGGNRFRCADQSFGPAIVPFVEGRSR